MPRQKKRNGPSKRNGATDMVLAQLVRDHHAATRADVLTVPADYKNNIRNWSLRQSPPKNFVRAVHWITSTIRGSFSTNTTGVPVEANQSFILNQNVSDYSSYASVFDQYCIHSAVVRLTPQASTGGSNQTYGRLITALDYDNVANLGSETLLLQYNTAVETELVIGKSMERAVRPALAPALWSGGAFSGYGVSRMWLNSTSTGVPHYGVRIMVVGAGNQIAMDYIVTVIVGFRNDI
jgi:hypothetical protein